MDAIKFLRSEHKKVRKMLGAIHKASGETTKKKLFTKFSASITNHEKMEEKFWYPYLRKNTKLSTIIKHLIAEEKKAAKKIKLIKKIKSFESWKKNFLLLKKSVEHHAAEEEKKLFPKADKQLRKIDLQDLGKRMKKFKIKALRIAS